jgi:hypothetical protein
VNRSQVAGTEFPESEHAAAKWCEYQVRYSSSEIPDNTKQENNIDRLMIIGRQVFCGKFRVKAGANVV